MEGTRDRSMGHPDKTIIKISHTSIRPDTTIIKISHTSVNSDKTLIKISHTSINRGIIFMLILHPINPCMISISSRLSPTDGTLVSCIHHLRLMDTDRPLPDLLLVPPTLLARGEKGSPSRVTSPLNVAHLVRTRTPGRPRGLPQAGQTPSQPRPMGRPSEIRPRATMRWISLNAATRGHRGKPSPETSGTLGLRLRGRRPTRRPTSGPP